MSHSIKTLYVVHHSHTDIGYTDLQERVVQSQVNYIRSALQLMQDPKNDGFRWNCETWFCVEQFLQQAAPEETEAFFARMKEGRIGFSANYLNFCDLADHDVLERRLDEVCALLNAHGVTPKTAMCADINGISMGQRDAMLDHGIEFLYTNIHCHHGMYPLYQNQTAYWWESASGKRMLVWNGEHYNLGNVLGLKPNRSANFMMQNFGADTAADAVDTMHKNLEDYLTLCEENGYRYDFVVASVSGVFSDNAPPEPEILRVIEEHARRYPEGTRIRMVSLQELYAAIAPKLQDSPVYHGDLTDWWANGAGSTPYAVKHYREAQHRYALARRLDPQAGEHYPELCRMAEDNLLLYAEHTWGHSSTITNPYDTMVLNLDMRKNSYASKAHEAASRMLGAIGEKKGDTLRYYNTSGSIRVCAPNQVKGLQPVEFYVESPILDRVRITCEDGTELPCQVSTHPRGRRITFLDDFTGCREKTYTYTELPALPATLNSRKCYVGAERIRDIINDYDPVTYRLPYGYENPWFRLDCRPADGVTALVDKRTGRNLLAEGAAPFFTPLYEVTPVRPGQTYTYEERRLLGRNIRGQHAVLSAGKLEEVRCEEHGPVFTQLRLCYTLPGTVKADVIVKLYEGVPRIDFTLQLGKTISSDVESVFLPMTLDLGGNRELWLKKGSEPYRPGVDQLPGTCMEYTMSDDGLAFVGEGGSALIASRDVPLYYFGEMRHHPIRLCDNKPENNRRPVYSWVMNNTWETNFKMDLSGFCEYNYSLWLSDETDPRKAVAELTERSFDPWAAIIG